jgi:hypothetical protein
MGAPDVAQAAIDAAFAQHEAQADGNLGIAASGGGRGVNVTVNVHNAPAGVQSQTSRVDSNGNVAACAC